ncbi:Sorting nexin-16 [Desmophyllum pertusum]|uniref:Sorting nexin-16 n=1 Tax=Desmophyllum pertusum TaxID=174260 RepID=A0A9W9ZCN2_9CNID|nr:Sorting nexin-16 [Desmophyllum pertusum]
MAEETSKDSDDNEYKFESFQTIEELDIHAPIVGYEVVEARKRFTVYQIFVQLGSERNWHVFRRYSDFVRMDEGLRKLFSDFHGILPPKKYVGDNFDPTFIEMRKLGLQEYIDNVIIRQDAISAQPVVEFFCFDDPPGPYDSIEESRAFIETLEDTVNDMRNRQNELASEIRLVKSQLRQSQAQKQALLIALRSERVLNGKPSHDNDDTQLMSEYSRLPEVAQLNDFKHFSRSNLRINEETSRQTHRLRSNRFPTSTTASQWDIRVETAEGLQAKRTPSLAGRRTRSTSDLSHPRNYRKRNSTHLPSKSGSRGNLTLLDKFMTQSTEALQFIRNSVRQKLGPTEDTESTTAAND